MDNEVKAAYDHLLNTAQMLLLLPADKVGAVVAEFSRMHAVMPILDPTGYRNVLPNIGGHERMVEIMARAHRELRALVEREG